MVESAHTRKQELRQRRASSDPRDSVEPGPHVVDSGGDLSELQDFGATFGDFGAAVSEFGHGCFRASPVEFMPRLAQIEPTSCPMQSGATSATVCQISGDQGWDSSDLGPDAPCVFTFVRHLVSAQSCWEQSGTMIFVSQSVPRACVYSRRGGKRLVASCCSRGAASVTCSRWSAWLYAFDGCDVPKWPRSLGRRPSLGRPFAARSCPV